MPDPYSASVQNFCICAHDPEMRPTAVAVCKRPVTSEFASSQSPGNKAQMDTYITNKTLMTIW